MKKVTLMLLTFIIVSLASCNSCKKEPTPQPDPDPPTQNDPPDNDPPPGDDQHVTQADLLAHYFITELSSGNLRVDYFFMDGNTLSGWRDGLGMRRGLESISLSGDTLQYTVSGTNVYTYVLKKGTGGKVAIVHAAPPEGSTAHAELQAVADATRFASTGQENIFHYVNGGGDAVYLYFGFTGAGNVWKHDGVTGTSAYMGYYLLHGEVGWKSNDDQTFGVAVSSWKGNSNVGMLIQSNVPELGEGIHAANEF